MPGTSRSIASALISGLLLAGTSAASERPSSAVEIRGSVASESGSISGLVQDEERKPVVGAVVSAIGPGTFFAVTDKEGRFEILALPAGPYVVRANSNGFVAPRAQVIHVSPNGSSTSSISLKHANAVPVLAAGIGGAIDPEQPAPVIEEPTEGDTADVESGDDSEKAWRLRHARRGILKSSDGPDDLLADSDPQGSFVPMDLLGQAFGSPARVATSFFTETPFSGQVNFLTTTTLGTPEQLFSAAEAPRGIAYVRVSAPVGERADWTVRGALTQADLSSWIIAGSYKTREPGRHSYDIGMSYSTQRYDGGNIFALREVTDGSRNAGTVYGFDTLTLWPALSVTYGGRYARYDYLNSRTLLSPQVELTVRPAEGVRLGALISRQAIAPGAEEFLPPSDGAIWLPPQRTFSSLDPENPLKAERTTHFAVSLERDIASSTIGIRAFHQHVDDQVVTLFGEDLPGQPPSKLGHYFVASAGEAEASGVAAELRMAIADRFHGSVEYSYAAGRTMPSSELKYLVFLAPEAARPRLDRIHSVSTTIEADVPETSTRVFVVYRFANAFIQPGVSQGIADRTGLDSRFDVQVNQALPFLDFTSAKWEMLLAVRNFFRDTTADQSVYDELFVVRPPKRVVGGLTLRF